MIPGIILLIISAIGFTVLIIGLRRTFKGLTPEVNKREINEVTHYESKGFLKYAMGFKYQKGVEYSVEPSAGMTCDEIESGLKRRDPDTITFVMIFSGFLFGLLGLLSGIGSIVVYYGNSDGWFLIGFAVVVLSLFSFIIIREKLAQLKNRKIN